MIEKSKRILMFSSNYLPQIGGAELALNEITKRIVDFHFDLITSRLDKSLPEEEKIGNVTVYRTGTAGAFLKIILPKSLFPVSAYLKARELTRNHGSYGVIFALQASQGAGAAWLYKIFNRKIPFIINIQEGKQLKKQGVLVNFFRNLILRRADVIIAISKYLKVYVQKINPKADLFIIPNGVDLQKFKGQDSRPKVKDRNMILSVSRLVEKNGLADLIESLKYLDDSIRLIIVGKGPLEKSLRQKVKNLNLENRIEFKGEVANERLPDYLAEADIFVRPSLSEGLGTAFIEAMAAGIPVIGTPVGGILDLIKNQETGLFCEVGNPKDIAAKIQTILNDNTLKQRLVSNAKMFVANNYNWDLIASRFRELFYKYGSI